MKLQATLKLKDIESLANIAERLTNEDLVSIGSYVWDNWNTDKTSRYEWEMQTAEAMKLALQVAEKKTFPWENSSNVKFPIVTIAALQFQSRAYPALLPSTSIVKTRVFGNDETGEKTARASRVANYMSFQLLEEDTTWESGMDELLISLAIVGCAFKKSYFNPELGHNVSEHVLAKDLYIPYFAKSLDTASRITQILYLTNNDILTKVRNDIYKKNESIISAVVDENEPLDIAKQESQGLAPAPFDETAPRELLEQHCWLDLDNDGYEEPYIVTMDKDTKHVYRIVARWPIKGVKYNKNKDVVQITATNYYTKYTFIPSPDGGIYDLGFGVLLGPLNHSINTVLNQLVDAGTLSNTAGGFLGRGVKFKSGQNSFKPFEWIRVDSTGDDLRKGIVPLEVRAPSDVLFQLLGMLIDYGERVGMATDPQVGINPGQNTPAETSRNTIAEGQRVFGAIFKRVYRALKEEFRKLYKLNTIYLEDSTNYFNIVSGKGETILREDFVEGDNEVFPAADPNMVTKEQKLNQAMVLKSAAAANPSAYNMYLVEKRFLQAMDIEDIESLLPDPQGPNAKQPTPDPKVVIETMKIEQKNAQLKQEMQLKMFDLMQEIEYLRAEILEKESRAALNLAQAEGVQDNLQITAIQSAVSLAKSKQDGLIATLNVLKDLAGFTKEKKGIVDGISGSMEGMEAKPDDQGVSKDSPG